MKIAEIARITEGFLPNKAITYMILKLVEEFWDVTDDNDSAELDLSVHDPNKLGIVVINTRWSPKGTFIALEKDPEVEFVFQEGSAWQLELDEPLNDQVIKQGLDRLGVLYVDDTHKICISRSAEDW